MLVKIEVRDSRTGYFIPVRYGMGVCPDGKIVGAPPPSPSASSGKCPNMRKCSLFHKWACPKNPEMLISGKKSRRRPNVEQSYLRKSNTSVLFMCIYIHIHTGRYTYIPQEKQHVSPMNLSFFTEISKSDFSSKS